jgi:hypothetical protein
MGYVVVKTSEHGTSNPIVARLSVQSKQLMEPFSVPEEKKKKLWAILHDKVQQQLLSCYDILIQVGSREAEIVAKVEKNGIQTQADGRVATIDQIENLNYLSGSFLYSAKSTLRDIKLMICEFYETDPEIEKVEKKDFGYLEKWAKERFGEADEFARLISEDFRVWINELYKKRNAVEHPGGYSGHLEIFNFTAVHEPGTKSWKGVIPRWRRNQDQPSSITKDMQVTIENLLNFSEDVLALCLRKAGSMLPLVFDEIPEESRDPECPIRLRVTLDQEKLKSQQVIPPDD